MHCIEVGIERLVEILGRHLAHIFAELLVPRIDDEDIESAKPLHRVLDQLTAPAFLAHVYGQRHRLAPRRLDQGDDFARILFLTRQIGDGNVRALARIGDRGGAPDAGIASGHERLAAHQLSRAEIAFLAVIGPWLQLAGNAGAGLRLLREGCLGYWLRGSFIMSRSAMKAPVVRKF